MNTLRRTHRALIALALAASAAHAQQIPAPETGPTRVNSRLVNNSLEMRDAATGAYIIADQQHPLVQHLPAGVTSDITLQQQPTGADVVVTLTNTTDQPKRGGTLTVGIMNLGQNVEYFDFRTRTTPRAITPGQTAGGMYPDDLYSPLTVIRNGQMAIGVSIQYPVMDYQHDLYMVVGSPSGSTSGPAGRGWMVSYQTANFGGENNFNRLAHSLIIPPGESRTYVMSVRVTRDVDQWVHTLTPYRNYFRAMYGGVQYQRNTNPVRGFTAAAEVNLSASSPYGFLESMRPDLRGYNMMVAELNRVQAPTVMVWALSGLHRNHRERNLPYLTASPLRNHPKLATAFDPTTGFPAVARSGRELGIWWGFSSLITRQWDTAEATPFDPTIPEHYDLALREMQAMYDLGARVIGMDTFCHKYTPIWKGIPWLHDMKARFEGIRFITEPSMCDIMHLVAATWVNGYELAPGDRPATVQDIYAIKGPDILADFLVPGHETWAGLGYDLHKRFFNIDPSPAYVINDLRRYAAWGYTPVVFEAINLPSDLTPAKSWETSLPASIVNSDPYIAALRQGNLPAPVASAISPPASPNAPPGTPPAPGAPSGGGSGGDTGGGDSGPSGPGLLMMPRQQDRNATKRSGASTLLAPRSGPAPQAPQSPAPQPGAGAGPAPAQPPIAITVTQRFMKKTSSRPPVLRADRTQGIMALIKRKQELEQQSQVDDD